LFCVKKRHIGPSPIGRLPINKRILPRGQAWQREEKEHYLAFLKNHFDLMERLQQEKSALKIYWQMSSFIKSKNYAQCRLHHSKLLARHGSAENIIRSC
jgi:hypothetical protein